MKLSIITINRNNAGGLKKTIESVVSQTFDNIEYIIIDGASTDKSIDVILSHKDKISYWVSEPDTGIYNAMNKGIRKANGDYLLFLNSGDYLVDETVIESVFVERPQSDIVCCRCNVSQDGKVIWVSNPPQRVTFATLFFQGLNHQSTFIKRSLFMDLGLYDESLIVITSDHEAHAAFLKLSPKQKHFVEKIPLYMVNVPCNMIGTHDNLLGQIDVFPTLLDLMGVSGRWRGLGRSVLNNESCDSIMRKEINAVSEMIIYADYFRNYAIDKE